MTKKTFFVCQNCGNVEKFKIFASNYKVILQSPAIGERIHETSPLPNLREGDNYVECQLCSKRVAYDDALNHGKRRIETNLLKKIDFSTSVSNIYKLKLF